MGGVTSEVFLGCTGRFVVVILLGTVVDEVVGGVVGGAELVVVGGGRVSGRTVAMKRLRPMMMPRVSSVRRTLPLRASFLLRDILLLIAVVSSVASSRAWGVVVIVLWRGNC